LLCVGLFCLFCLVLSCLALFCFVLFLLVLVLFLVLVLVLVLFLCLCVFVCVSVCVCVGALSSDGDALCICLLLPHVGVRDKLPPDLLRHRLPSAMPRQSKFDKAMLKVMEADWVVRHRMLSWMRRLSQRASHLVLMLTACQTPLSDYIVAHLSATCRSPLIDFRFAHMLATLVSQRL
jgi:hypothetical protein